MLTVQILDDIHNRTLRNGQYNAESPVKEHQRETPLTSGPQ